MFKQKVIVLLLMLAIITLAVVTRFYKLGGAPAGLYLDEAAQGYNAYSILKTGKDEFGKSFPIVFRSFTDFKTPVYIYLVVPLIPLFDLTSFTIRFPSFFFSILTIPIFYLLVCQLFNQQQKSINNTNKLKVNPRGFALISSLLLAISPWHILFGRTNFECNVALFFLLAGILAFYKGLERPSLLIASAILLAIAIPAYHAQRVVVPLMALVLFLRHRKTLLSPTYVKYLVVSAIIGFFILLPTLAISRTPGFLARAGLNIFNYDKTKPAGFISDCAYGRWCNLINNRFYLHTREFLALYTSYFAPRNMFYLGDYGPRSSFPGLATFYLWQLPFYIVGLYKLTKLKRAGEFSFFTIALLLIAPVPAAVTRDPYTTIRALQMVIPLTIIVTLGLYTTFVGVRPIGHKLLGNFGFILTTSICSLAAMSYSIAKLYSSVIVLNEFKRAVEWNYGFEQVAKKISQINQASPVVVDNARTEPYSQLLFFLKFDPETYQKENFEVSTNDYYTNLERNKTKKIGNIVTRPINWETDLIKDQYLVGDELAISKEQIANHKLTLTSEITHPDGSTAFRIVKTNPEFELQSRKQVKSWVP